MTNREKFLGLVSEDDDKVLAKNRLRIANRHWLRASQEVAMKILDRLEALDWSQKDLAEKMEVSPQYINKIVKGKENLTLDTLVKLQQVLNIPILASYEEPNVGKTKEYILEETPIVLINYAQISDNSHLRVEATNNYQYLTFERYHYVS